MAYYRILTRMFYCEIERDEWFEYSEASPQAAIELLVAELQYGDSPSVEEAVVKAKKYIEEAIGANWTVEKFLKSGLEIWESDNMPGYLTRYIEEVKSA